MITISLTRTVVAAASLTLHTDFGCSEIAAELSAFSSALATPVSALPLALLGHGLNRVDLNWCAAGAGWTKAERYLKSDQDLVVKYAKVEETSSNGVMLPGRPQNFIEVNESQREKVKRCRQGWEDSRI